MRPLFAAFLVANLFLSGCVTVSNHANNVIPISSINMTQLDKTRKGESCAKSVLGITWGSNNISDAAKNGGISKVGFVESRLEFYLVYFKFCTVVYSASGDKKKEKQPAG